MSLINDALKRASRAQKENPAPPPPELHFRPAEPSPRPAYGSAGLLIIGLLVALLLGGLLVLYALRQPGSSPTLVKAAQPETTATQTAVAAADKAVVAPPANPATAPARVPASTAPAQPSVTANLETPPTAVPNASPAVTSTNVAPGVVTTDSPKPPAPKLQGIFFNPSRPSAVVSGKSVYVGSRVGEFQVLAITQEGVTLGNNSVTNVLSLEQ